MEARREAWMRVFHLDFFYIIEQSCTAANQTIENELMTQQLY
jgi:hypothetical protein